MVTSHKSQGRTADKVVVAAAALDCKAAYVACSRGRQSCAVFTPDKEALFARLPRSADRRAVLDVLKEQEAIRAYLPSPAARGRAARPDLLAAAVATAPDVAAAPGAGRGRAPAKSKDLAD